MARLFLLFTILPVIELYLLIRIGRVVGAWQTVFFLVLMGMVGAWLARSQGRRVIGEMQSAMNEGRVPTEGLLGGLLVLVGGVLLITPGVISDVLGIVLLLPFTRRLVAKSLRKYFEEQVQAGHVRVQTSGGFTGFSGFSGGASRPQGARFDPRFGTVIDTEGERVE